MENTDARVLLLDDDDRQILLVLEKEKKIDFPGGKSFIKPSKWGMPGGRSEPEDKDEIATAVREVLHEIGIFPEINSRLRAERREEDHLRVGFIGYPTSRDIKIDPKEILDCRWFPRRILYDEEFDMYFSHRRMAQELLRKLRR